MTDERVDQVFAALSDSTRRTVMRCLSEAGAASASEIAAQLPITRQAVAKHLSALDGAGLVASEVMGRERRYRLTPEPLEDALTWIADVGSAWDARLHALEGFLATPKSPD